MSIANDTLAAAENANLPSDIDLGQCVFRHSVATPCDPRRPLRTCSEYALDCPNEWKVDLSYSGRIDGVVTVIGDSELGKTLEQDGS
ncbi:hypothetical protein LPH56_02800 [Xylella taiwanensis]|uniref:hypothetical protein n=1 Tax=Xylella taiwanensis TaxID=1444770 RepID=UPI001E419E9B|nr:hypothetical protein [Xylella taiwanensis]UFS52380.1 hypothetical protein LPH56_02800 [Xylella taiwanensis]